MSEDFRAFVTALAIVFLICLFVLIFTGEPRHIAGQDGGNLIRNVLFDFQTLFTGIAAIGAAYATVREMRRADDRSDKIHRENIFVATEHKYELAEALLYRSFKAHSIITALDDMWGPTPEMVDPDRKEKVTQFLFQLQILADDKSWEDGEHTFRYPQDMRIVDARAEIERAWFGWSRSDRDGPVDTAMTEMALYRALPYFEMVNAASRRYVETIRAILKK